jgi:SAM-dependent methyltransferase
MELLTIKKNIYRAVAEKSPGRAAMFIKNWRRYEACVDYILSVSKPSPESTVLDYGCGHPFVSKILIDLGYRVIPYEPYAGEEELHTAELLGIRALYKTKLDEGVQYDIVLMIDVIEHLSIIKPIMNDVNSKTKTGGLLFVSTPNVMRIEMWLSFVLRQTGHPQPLNKFLNGDNNYSNHQREFTMGELKQTAQHFGYSVIKASCRVTSPTHTELVQYHSFSGITIPSISFKKKILNAVYDVFRFVAPSKFSNNLLLVGKKIR